MINIFQSRAFKEERNSLFDQSQVDIFLDNEIIKDVINNIKFFIYNTTFIGSINNDVNTFYEYGNINLDIEDESVALLIFYGFHIIINIQEIGVNLNINILFLLKIFFILHI